MENQKMVRFQKNADKVLNRVIIPKFFIDKYGRNFYMDVYEDHIEIIPIKIIPINKGGE